MLYFKGLWIKINRNTIKTHFLAPFVLVLVGASSSINEPYFVLGNFLFRMSMRISAQGLHFYED